MAKGNYTIRIQNVMNYDPYIEKHIEFVKELNSYGDSKLLGYIVLCGSLVLLVFVLGYLAYDRKSELRELPSRMNE